MSIFANIVGKIFPKSHPALATLQGAAPTTPSSPAVAPVSIAAAPPVDVEGILAQMAEKNPEKLNWRSSIVDLLKLLNLDSSLEERKRLARELDYRGDLSSSAEMNIWLQKQVMQKLAENGGRVPQDLLH